MPLSEFEIIEQYFKHLTGNSNEVSCGIGDDAAVVALPAGSELVTSVDTLVGDVHFLAAADAYDIGYKTLAVNLSDMAAMAAEPRWVTLALTLPENNVLWLERFAQGFSDLAQRHSVCLIGGDLTHGPLSVTVQIMGIVAKGCAIKRTGAQADDYVYVSNCLGGAGYALQGLLGGLPDNNEIPGPCEQQLLRPEPRLALGYKLRGFATAMIDISDGLAADLGHILRASAVGAMIELDKIPVCKGLEQISAENSYWQTVLCSGDDYELCFTVPASKRAQLESFVAETDQQITCIGRIAAGSELHWLLPDGSEYDLQLTGYRHF